MDLSNAFNPMIDQAIKRLNEMLAADPDAITALVRHRVSCNRPLAEHPTCRVRRIDDAFDVGLLGVINGIFGLNDEGKGYISIATDSQTQRITKFVRTPDEE